MKRSHAALIATAIPLLLTSLRATAGELPFNAPATQPTRLHWSALIGTGDAARTPVAQRVTSSSETNVPPSQHWTANIGTGTAAASTRTPIQARQRSPSAAQPVIAVANWTSRIGTGHALDSITPVM